MYLEQQINLLEWFLKDHVTLKPQGDFSLLPTDLWFLWRILHLQMQNKASQAQSSIYSELKLKIEYCYSKNAARRVYSGYGKYSDPLKFFTLCYIAAIC